MADGIPRLYPNHEAAEEAIRSLILVLPNLIVEIAKQIHEDWLDGRTSPMSEADLMEKVERIVTEKLGG